MLWEHFSLILIQLHTFPTFHLLRSKGWHAFKSYQIVLLSSVEPTAMWLPFHRSSWRRRRKERPTSLTEWTCRLKSWVILQQTEPSPRRGDPRQAWSQQSTLVIFVDLSLWLWQLLPRSVNNIEVTSSVMTVNNWGRNHWSAKPHGLVLTTISVDDLCNLRLPLQQWGNSHFILCTLVR